MTIKEMNVAIEDMRKIVPFEDDKTKICLGDIISGNLNPISVTVATRIDDVNIEMSKYVKKDSME